MSEEKYCNLIDKKFILYDVLFDDELVFRAKCRLLRFKTFGSFFCCLIRGPPLINLN